MTPYFANYPPFGTYNSADQLSIAFYFIEPTQ